MTISFHALVYDKIFIVIKDAYIKHSISAGSPKMNEVACLKTLYSNNHTRGQVIPGQSTRKIADQIDADEITYFHSILSMKAL